MKDLCFIERVMDFILNFLVIVDIIAKFTYL